MSFIRRNLGCLAASLCLAIMALVAPEADARTEKLSIPLPANSSILLESTSSTINTSAIFSVASKNSAPIRSRRARSFFIFMVVSMVRRTLSVERRI